MLSKANFIRIFSTGLLFFCFFSCKNNHSVKEKEIVKAPEKMDDQIADNINAVPTLQMELFTILPGFQNLTC
jgi:hypothetical protein